MTTATIPAVGSTRSRRFAELALLVFAVLLSMAAYVTVELGETHRIPEGILGYTGALVGLFGIAHLLVRRFARYADPILLPTAVALNGLGVVLIHRLDLSDGTGVARTQLLWTAIGVALFVAVLVAVRDHKRLQRYTYTAMAAGMVLLLLPLLPFIGTTINGARIWVHVGPLSLQPAEFAKIALIVFFASYLVAKRDVLALAGRRVLAVDLPRGRDLGPILVAWLLSLAVLVFERDLGTSLLFFSLFVVVLYVATERLSWLLFGVVLFSAGSFVAYHLFGHVRTRVDIWLHPFADAAGESYQLVQGLYGLAAGGILGTGLGKGHPSLVPFANSDFIVTTAGEELGLTGLMALLVLYAVLVERGLRIAIAVRDPFGKLLAAGLAFSLGLQVFVVVGGVTGLIPLTGLTTPFMSAGGSSLVANWMLVALLLRVSDAARRPPPDTSHRPARGDAAAQVVSR